MFHNTQEDINTNELIKRVHKIEIKAKGLSTDVFSGKYKSAFKGRGMAFSEVRQYIYGDEIRTIDWNVSARFNQPYVKVFEQERELTLMLMIDVSRSTLFGSKTSLKTQTIAEIAATLAFSAISNNDKVGALLFSDKTELYIPPQKGSQHCLRIIREILTFKPKGGTTNYSEPFVKLNNLIKRRTTCFFITDGLSDFDKNINVFASRHDLCAIIVNDPMEYNLPQLDTILIEDFETKEYKWVDTDSKYNQKLFRNYMIKKQEDNTTKFKKLGIDFVQLLTNEDYTLGLIKLFAQR